MNWTQLRAMLWLRWRLTHNRWRRGGQLGAVIMLLAWTVGLGLAVLGGILGIAGGALGLSKASPPDAMIAWDTLVGAFLFFWTMGLVTELQRSELLDLGRLLTLPVSLRDVFLLNYVASHLSLSLAIFLPAMLGLVLGLVLARGPAMLLLAPLVFGFFFMISAWTYCLRGWLAALMVNKRRRRAIVIGVTMLFMLLVQLPNLLSNVWFRNSHPGHAQTPLTVQEQAQRVAEHEANTMAVFAAVHRYVPPLWLPLGAKNLAEGRAWPAVLGAAGMILIGAGGLARAYRSTVRFYRGGQTAKPARARPAARKIASGRRILVERNLPPVPNEAAAMALASFRSMSRAPEVKMALLSNTLIFAILGASMFVRGPAALPDAARPFLAAASVVVAMMASAQVMFNLFGFDRSGFRTLVLLPTPRRHILLGKNIAVAPAGLVVFVAYMVMVLVFVHLAAWDVVAAGFEFVAALAAMSVLGNVLSILVPYRVAAGSLKPTKTGEMTKVLIFVTHLLFPLAVLPVFLPAGLGFVSGHFGWLPRGLVTVAGAAVLAALSVLLYWRTLEPLGRLLEERERKILEVVTREVE